MTAIKVKQTPMEKLTRKDLYSLEDYNEMRPEFRRKIMEHKKNRIIAVGDHVKLHFEDRLLMQYQVQEMLRAEKIFDAEGIQEELDAYNPLIPDGANLKATMMIEFADVTERHKALAEMIGIEIRTWVQVEGHDKVYATADEDLERDTEEKTSSVHFLRFELTPAMVESARQGAAIGVGVDHEAYQHAIPALPGNYRDSLAADLH
jgi:hypothetical protein